MKKPQAGEGPLLVWKFNFPHAVTERVAYARGIVTSCFLI